jgi:flagellar biosynthesis/type III secretory pathway protein FliH
LQKIKKGNRKEKEEERKEGRKEGRKEEKKERRKEGRKNRTKKEEIRKLDQTIRPLKITALCSGVMSRWASASIS